MIIKIKENTMWKKYLKYFYGLFLSLSLSLLFSLLWPLPMAQFSLGSWMGCFSMKIYLHLSGSCSKWYVLYWQPHYDMVSENYVKSFLWKKMRFNEYDQWRWINMFNLLLIEFQAYLHCFIFYWLVKLSIFLFNKDFKIEYKFDIKDVKRYFF